MQLTRTLPKNRLISLVSLVDVLLIMLVFFMVTSTYLNLDMIPLVDQVEDTATLTTTEHTQPVVMIRLGPDGQAILRGKTIVLDDWDAVLASHFAEGRKPSIVILPSPRASTQALVSLLDSLMQAGIAKVRILQLESTQ